MLEFIATIFSVTLLVDLITGTFEQMRNARIHDDAITKK